MKINQLGKPTASALVLGLALASGWAGAQVTYFAPLTQFEDQDLDFFVNNVGLATSIDVGDRLVAPLEVFSTAPVGGGPASSVPVAPELTGIADITVISKTCVDGLCTFLFGPTVGGTFANPDLNGAAAGAGTGALVGFWTSAPNLDLVGVNCTSLADCTARAIDGPLYFTAGFTGDPNERWRALNAPENPAVVQGINATTPAGSVNFGLNFIINNTGQAFGLQSCDILSCAPGSDFAIQITGGGTIHGGQGLTNGAFARSDFDYQVALPEPGSLLLLSTVLGVVGFASRRRRPS